MDNNQIKFNTGPEATHHKELMSFLEDKKFKNNNYKVLDVGGACCGRFWKVTDVILDWKEPNCCVDSNNNPYSKFGTKYIKGNILKIEGWKAILDYVNLNGKFDFVLCTHTLEDLLDPSFVIDMLQKVAKSGYISVPSKESEIRKFYHSDFPNFMGCGHHFWIFVSYKGKLIGMPKMNWIEHFTSKDLWNVNPSLGGSGATHILFPKQELNLYWENKIDYCLLLPVDINSLPTEFENEYNEIFKIYKEKKQPWEVWKYLLNNSD
jgi:hypothetical protein